jgi:hypothetical protein
VWHDRDTFCNHSRQSRKARGTIYLPTKIRECAKVMSEDLTVSYQRRGRRNTAPYHNSVRDR